MHFSCITGSLKSYPIWRYFLFLHSQKFPLQPLATLSFSFFWSVNYANLVYKLFITLWKCQDTQIIAKYLILTNIGSSFSTVYCFLATFVGRKIVWVESVNSAIFFWLARKLRQDLYLRVLSFSIMDSLFPTSRFVFSFFHLACKLFNRLFQPFSQPLNCMS